jgi:hypothetical protein
VKFCNRQASTEGVGSVRAFWSRGETRLGGFGRVVLAGWLALLATLVLAGVVPASASESSGAAAWGLNTDGQLGNGTTTTEKEAVAVKVLTEATAVAGANSIASRC